nr:hypothetical protein [candidate division Zixibacteria bacterium]
MSGKRLVYCDWIVKIGVDPRHRYSLPYLNNNIQPNERVVRAVREALEHLSPLEREFIERYYFKGESYRKIALALNRRFGRMESLHRRTVGRLRKLLARFVKTEFDLENKIKAECPLCISPYRVEIDALIESKTKEETWKNIIRILKEKYGIIIQTPQILIGHHKYH